MTKRDLSQRMQDYFNNQKSMLCRNSTKLTCSSQQKQNKNPNKFKSFDKLINARGKDPNLKMASPKN